MTAAGDARRWSPEQVAAAAPSPAALAAARPLSTAASWSRTGCDERAVWGTYHGTAAEPYDTMVDTVGVGYTCSCPSRRVPCKHALALLLMWIDERVPDAVAPAAVEGWLARRRPPISESTGPAAGSGSATPTEGSDAARTPGESAGTTEAPRADAADESAPGDTPQPPTPDLPAGGDPPGRDERVERMRAGLDELDRWLEDRIRLGLSDPSLANYATWDQLAARLVDARAGSLANRIRRLAGLVGTSPDWHSDVLAELGVLHLLAQAGRRIGTLSGPLADGVATSVGWQVRQADVLAGVPDTDRWIVAGRSDTREDRIEVRRHWLYGERTGRWALVLSFAAYRQSLDTSLIVGAALECDLHRYPGPALRALIGERSGDWSVGAAPPAVGVRAACEQLGELLIAEPWLDRLPFTVHAALASTSSGWVLGDADGTLPVLRRDLGRTVDRSLATLLAVSAGAPIDVTCEWTPHGVVPLTVHLDDRAIDIGPRADPSFVGAA